MTALDNPHKLIQELWQHLAAHPYNRALVIARAVLHVASPELTAWAIRQIDSSTPEGDEKTEALRLLTAPPPPLHHPFHTPPGSRSSRSEAGLRPYETFAFPTPLPLQDRLPQWGDSRPVFPLSCHVEHIQTRVRVDVNRIELPVDPEIGRLAIGLHQASPLRIWTIGREMTRQADGRGYVTRKALVEQLEKFEIIYTRQHRNRILKGGDGLFWNLSSNRVYLRSPMHVAECLAKQAMKDKPDLVRSNLPGVRVMYLPVTGSLEQWEALLYAGWLAHREDPTIARETLAMLFNRNDDTIRRWEQHRLKEIVTIRPNYAQCVNPLEEDDRYFDHLPERSQGYVASAEWNGKRVLQVRLRWRLPNTYVTTPIRQHPKKGQAGKVRRRVNVALDLPADERRGGLPRSRRYYYTPKHLKDHVRKHGTRRSKFLFRGENRHGHGIFELNSTGYPVTHARERLPFAAESRYFEAEALRSSTALAVAQPISANCRSGVQVLEHFCGGQKAKTLKR